MDAFQAGWSLQAFQEDLATTATSNAQRAQGYAMTAAEQAAAKAKVETDLQQLVADARPRGDDAPRNLRRRQKLAPNQKRRPRLTLRLPRRKLKLVPTRTRKRRLKHERTLQWRDNTHASKHAANQGG